MSARCTAAPAPDAMPGLNRARFTKVLLACLALLLFSLLLSPLFGSSQVDLRAAFDFTRPLADNPAARVLLYGRLPRVLAAATAGAGLAAAGVAFQALLRNPLACPFTLGVSSGSSLGAVLAIRFGLESLTVFGLALGELALPLSASLFALLVVGLVFWLGERGSAGPTTLLLSGVTLAVLSGALIMAVIYTADFGQTYRIVRWQMGDLDVMRYDLVLRMAVPVLLALALLWPRARDLNALSAGPDAAAGLGVDVRRATRWVYLCSSLAVGAVVAVAGPIGFVGLLVPHTLRSLLGPDHRLLLPASALCGGSFLVLCDLLSQVVARPAVLPVGVLTACIGAPFFVALLLSRGLRARLWS
jgi:iron complex transport system permease protein